MHFFWNIFVTLFCIFAIWKGCGVIGMSFSCRFEAAVSFVTQNLGMSLSWYIVVPSTAGAGIHSSPSYHSFLHSSQRRVWNSVNAVTNPVWKCLFSPNELCFSTKTMVCWRHHWAQKTSPLTAPQWPAHLNFRFPSLFTCWVMQLFNCWEMAILTTVECLCSGKVKYENKKYLYEGRGWSSLPCGSSVTHKWTCEAYLCCGFLCFKSITL